MVCLCDIYEGVSVPSLHKMDSSGFGLHVAFAKWNAPSAITHFVIMLFWGQHESVRIGTFTSCRTDRCVKRIYMCKPHEVIIISENVQTPLYMWLQNDNSCFPYCDNQQFYTTTITSRWKVKSTTNNDVFNSYLLP